MDEELMQAIEIPITLIFVMTVLGIIFTTIGVTKGAFQGYTNSVDMQVVNAYDSELIALGEYGKSIPVTTVFSTLKKNEGVISQVSGYGKTRQGDPMPIAGTTVSDQINSLQNLFDSKVMITVAMEYSGFYTVVVKEG